MGQAGACQPPACQPRAVEGELCVPGMSHTLSEPQWQVKELPGCAGEGGVRHISARWSRSFSSGSRGPAQRFDPVCPRGLHSDPPLTPCLEPHTHPIPSTSALYFCPKIRHHLWQPESLIVLFGLGFRREVRGQSAESVLPSHSMSPRDDAGQAGGINSPTPTPNLTVIPRFTKMFCFVPHGGK